MRSQTVKPQFAENVVIRIQNQNKAVEAAKKAHEQAKQTLDDFLRDAAGRRGREGDWGPGSDNSTRENSMRGEVIQRKQQMELAEAELSRLEGIASIGWAGLSVLVAVKAKAAAIDAAKTQLAEELSEAEAEVEALDEQIKEAELQLALRAEFSQGTSSDDDLTGVVAERDEASKRAESLRKRLMAYRADSPGLGRQLGIATPATELEKLTSELRAEVETVRAKAVEDAAEAQTRFDALLNQLEAAARDMGNIKSRLMLVDEELVSAGLAATDAHLDINLRLPNMNTLDTRFRTAFLDGPSKVNQSYWHHW